MESATKFDETLLNHGAKERERENTKQNGYELNEKRKWRR
jgi:hypothetical protein